MEPDYNYVGDFRDRILLKSINSSNLYQNFSSYCHYWEETPDSSFIHNLSLPDYLGLTKTEYQNFANHHDAFTIVQNLTKNKYICDE